MHGEIGHDGGQSRLPAEAGDLASRRSIRTCRWLGIHRGRECLLGRDCLPDVARHVPIDAAGKAMADATARGLLNDLHIEIPGLRIEIES
jgi:hypothetical protein